MHQLVQIVRSGLVGELLSPIMPMLFCAKRFPTGLHHWQMKWADSHVASFPGEAIRSYPVSTLVGLETNGVQVMSVATNISGTYVLEHVTHGVCSHTH